MSEQYHIHLISDSTGETTLGVLKASIAQFEGVEAQEHIWPMVRSSAQMEQVIEGIRSEEHTSELPVTDVSRMPSSA